MESSDREALNNVKQYYGSTIQSRADLCTTACLVDESQATQSVREARRRVHEEVKDRFYGCGSPIPPAIEGLVVLDMGCGSGLDCYILSQMVGPRGRVIGVDMSPEQIAVATKHQDWHAKKFGYNNVEFLHGEMEDLTKLGIADASVDLVVSNCVLNLSLSKARVVREIFRVLKPGGELYFSDVFADRRLPRELIQDPTLHGECLAGAWYSEDLRRLLASSGCGDMRITSSRPITIQNENVVNKIGFAAFTSCTVRAFKLDSLEDRCEDYNQIATYRGNIPGHPHLFQLDDHHEFPKGKRVPVCGNTADMLVKTRFASAFDLLGDKSTHFGLFQCNHSASESSNTPKGANQNSQESPSCC